MTDHAENPAQTMRDTMEDLHGLTHITPDTQNFDFANPKLVAIPKGMKTENLTSDYLAAAQYLKPAARWGTAKLATLQSVIDWANRFKSADSALFANPDQTAPSLTCIADYHGAGAALINAITGDPTARHCRHRAVYNFPLSKEWKRWTAISGQPMDRHEIGQFIEDNAKDFLDPTPYLMNPETQTKPEPWESALAEIARKIKGRFGQYVKLLEMSRAFEVNETSALKVTRNPISGEQSIAFASEHQDGTGQPISVPDLFLIAIPVFNSGALYRLPIRFQYRKSGASIKFMLSIYDPDRAFDGAFDEATANAVEKTELPLFEGIPEA